MIEKKHEEQNKKLQKIGCLMTIMFTIPIFLAVILGPIGLAIGIIIATFGVIKYCGKKR